MDMYFEDYTHGPFDAQAYIESLSNQFGLDYTLETYHQLPQFFGNEEEDPCLHLDRFEAVCGSYDVGMSERLRFMFFPLSLQSLASYWCYDGKWTNWEQCHKAFIDKYLPIHQTFTHSFQIKSFSQTRGEAFYECWERFKILLDTFPNHGLELGDILVIFYSSLLREWYLAFDLALGRDFLDLTPSEGWSFLESFYARTRPQERHEPNFESHVLENHTALPSLDPIESPLTPTEHLNDTWPTEYIIESVDPSSLHNTPEVESGAHLSPFDLAPTNSPTMGIVSDYHETDHHCGEVVDTGVASIDFMGVERSLKPTIFTSIDFLGIEKFIEPTISMSMYASWPHLRFHAPHLAFHPLVCFTPEECPPSVLRGPEENILFLKPFADAWDREGVG